MASRGGARRQRRHRIDRESCRRRGSGGCSPPGRPGRRYGGARRGRAVDGRRRGRVGEFASGHRKRRISRGSGTSWRPNRRPRRTSSPRIYVRRGLEPDLARTVARQLTAKGAMAAHARDELGLTDELAARPLQAALASAATFAVGAGVPIVTIVAPANALVLAVGTCRRGACISRSFATGSATRRCVRSPCPASGPTSEPARTAARIPGSFPTEGAHDP